MAKKTAAEQAVEAVTGLVEDYAVQTQDEFGDLQIQNEENLESLKTYVSSAITEAFGELKNELGKGFEDLHKRCDDLQEQQENGEVEKESVLALLKEVIGKVDKLGSSKGGARQAGDGNEGTSSRKKAKKTIIPSTTLRNLVHRVTWEVIGVDGGKNMQAIIPPFDPTRDTIDNVAARSSPPTPEIPHVPHFSMDWNKTVVSSDYNTKFANFIAQLVKESIDAGREGVDSGDPENNLSIILEVVRTYLDKTLRDRFKDQNKPAEERAAKTKANHSRLRRSSRMTDLIKRRTNAATGLDLSPLLKTVIDDAGFHSSEETDDETSEKVWKSHRSEAVSDECHELFKALDEYHKVSNSSTSKSKTQVTSTRRVPGDARSLKSSDFKAPAYPNNVFSPSWFSELNASQQGKFKLVGAIDFAEEMRLIKEGMDSLDSEEEGGED